MGVVYRYVELRTEKEKSQRRKMAQEKAAAEAGKGADGKGSATTMEEVGNAKGSKRVRQDLESKYVQYRV